MSYCVIFIIVSIECTIAKIIIIAVTVLLTPFPLQFC